MQKRHPFLAAATLAALLPLSSIGTAAEAFRPALRLAMMDMMPMDGGGGMPQQGSGGAGRGDGMRMGGQLAQGAAGMRGMGQPGAAPQSGAPQPPPQPGQPGDTGRMMDNNMTPMGGGMPAQGQGQMPMGQMPMGQMPMGQMPMGQMPMGQMPMGQMPMGQMPMGQMPIPMQGGTGVGMGSPAARLEGRIAFLRTELRITDAQAPAWEAFANTLRVGREHLDAARTVLQDSTAATDPMVRLEAFESHLRQRTEAVHTTRMAFSTLYTQLDDTQKRVATTTLLPFIGTF